MSKKYIIGMCFCCMLLILAYGSVFAGSNVLFYDDFSENPADRWTQISQNEGEEWIWDEDEKTWSLHIDYPADNLQIVGDESWTDYAIELKAKSPTRMHWGILLRGRYDNDNIVGIVVNSFHMEFLVEEFPSWSRIGEVNNPMRFDEDGTPSLYLESDKWYVLRVEVRGNNAKIFLDGEELGDVNFRGYDSGFVGIYSFVHEHNTFDYVKITEL